MKKKIIGIMICLLFLSSNIIMMGSAVKTRTELNEEISENTILLNEQSIKSIPTAVPGVKFKGGINGWLQLWESPNMLGYYIHVHVNGRKIMQGFTDYSDGRGPVYQVLFDSDYYSIPKLIMGNWVKVKNYEDETVKTVNFMVLVFRHLVIPIKLSS